MPQFKFDVGVKLVEGHQRFAVEADTAEEALKKIKAGEGEIVAEELEVQSLNWHDALLVEGEG